MSKFIEMLESAGERAPGPIGFGPAAARKPTPQIVLVARVLEEELAGDPGLADADAVALLLGADYPLAEPAVTALKDKVWGVRLSEPSVFSADQAKSLLENGCDFIVFESMETEAGALIEEDLGTVATVSPDLGEETVRATVALPLDAVLFGPAQRNQPLTVGDLVEVQRVRRLVSMPFIVEAPMGLGQADLQALRDLGVAGLIVDAPPLEKIAEVKALIEALPRPQRGRSRDSALVPYVSGDVPVGPAEPEEDDAEEDDF